MSRAQRLSFLAVAVVIAVVAAILIAGSGEDDTDTEQAAATPTPTATSTETPAPQEASPQETATPTPTPKPKPPLLQAGKVTRLEFTKGDAVKFRVASDEDEQIHVHGYDIEKEIPAGETVTVAFEATIDGIFEIELHHSEEQIGELRVQPE